MIKTISIAAAGLLLAATGAAVSASEPEGSAPKQEKKICKSEKMTGSLTRVRRTCLTQSEWDRLAEGTRRNVDTLARDANRTQTMGMSE